MMGCLDVSDTECLRSLVKGLIEAADFCQVSMDFDSKGAMSTFKDA